VAVLGPVLGSRGYTLVRDLVVVPDPPLSARLIGADGSVPRAVPSDLAVALLARAAPSDLVEKAVLAVILALAAAGAARLALRVAGAGPAGAVVAGLVYAWSPYLAERLVLGQWALLLGVAALPWAVEAAVRARRGALPDLATTCAWTVPAAVGGGNAVAIVAPVVLAVLLAPGADAPLRSRTRAALAFTGFAVVAGLPWILPSVLRQGGLPSDPAGVEAFAAGADGPLGVAGSLVTLGGIWNAAVVPPERSSVLLAAVALAAVVAALVAGVPGLLRRPGGAGIVLGGVLALALAGVGATAPGAALWRWVVLTVPGAGLLRDGQKFLAGWVLLVALAGAVAVGRATDALRRTGVAPLVAAAAALLPVALTPSLAWAASGRLGSVEYPGDWSRVRSALDADPGPGAVVVLPWGAYRRFGWNDLRVVLDPAQRITARPVVQDDDLALRRGTVAGEDPRARLVAAAVEQPGTLTPRLAALGYRYVLLHAADTAAPGVRARLGGSACVVCGADLELRRLGPADATSPSAPAGTPRAAPVPVLVAGLAAAALAALAAVSGALVPLLDPLLRSAPWRRARSGEPAGPTTAESSASGSSPSSSRDSSAGSSASSSG